jgi:hypothetical protein
MNTNFALGLGAIAAGGAIAGFGSYKATHSTDSNILPAVLVGGGLVASLAAIRLPALRLSTSAPMTAVLAGSLALAGAGIGTFTGGGIGWASRAAHSVQPS